MRRKFITGNWKMNLDRAGCVALAEGLLEAARGNTSVDIAVCAPFVYIDAVAQVLKGSCVAWGAQNCYFKGNGAYTGEISLDMLKDLGCTYVILGHSERRKILGETDALINEKVKAALAAGLIPILCVGETLDERDHNRTEEVIRGQFDGSLADISAEDMLKIVIAYEPVWAIGTGKVATPAQAEEVHANLRKLMESRYNKEVADSVRIQYGGSVKPDNAKELLFQPDIDGALVGGAALKVDSFMGIINALN